MQLELNVTELDVLRRVMARHLPALREEVYKTENYDWREALKHDEVSVKAIITRLDRLAAGEGARVWPVG